MLHETELMSPLHNKGRFALDWCSITKLPSNPTAAFNQFNFF